MKLSDVQDRITRIASEGDDAAQHSMEDSLFRRVLRAIANGDCEDCTPAELAFLALQTFELPFNRWHA